MIEPSGVVSVFSVKARHSDALDALVVQIAAVSAGLATYEFFALFPLKTSCQIPLLAITPLLVVALVFWIAVLTIKRCYGEVEELSAKAEVRANERWSILEKG